MSVTSQQQFLDKFTKNLAKASKTYRRYTANKQTHVFVASMTGIKQGVLSRLIKSSGGDTKLANAIWSEVTEEAKQVIDDIRDKLEVNKKDTVSVIRILEYIPGEKVKALFASSVNDSGKQRNIYKQVYQSYAKKLGQLAVRISEVSRSKGLQSSEKAKKYWNLEHSENEGIAESKVADAMNEALAGIDDILPADAKAWLESSGVEIQVIRDTRSDRMFVSVGSAVDNLAEGRKSQQRVKDLKQIVKDAKSLLEDSGKEVLNLPGSPSFVDIKRKQLLLDTITPFLKINNLKVSIKENTKIKHTKTKNKSSNQPKALASKKERINIAAKAGGMGKYNKRAGRNSPIALMAIINSRLPATVAENMGPPKLENQTGRLAQSAKVTDIQTTREGFPSIGYTYQKQPYGVFESTSGSRFSSVERDPRRLIEGSIREIAAELAIGRFYTRRI